MCYKYIQFCIGFLNYFCIESCQSTDTDKSENDNNLLIDSWKVTRIFIMSKFYTSHVSRICIDMENHQKARALI